MRQVRPAGNEARVDLQRPTVGGFCSIELAELVVENAQVQVRPGLVRVRALCGFVLGESRAPVPRRFASRECGGLRPGCLFFNNLYQFVFLCSSLSYRSMAVAI